MLCVVLLHCTVHTRGGVAEQVARGGAKGEGYVPSQYKPTLSEQGAIHTIYMGRYSNNTCSFYWGGGGCKQRESR